MLTAIVIVIL